MSLVTLFVFISICYLYWNERLMNNNYIFTPLNHSLLGIRIALLDPLYISLSVIACYLAFNLTRYLTYKTNSTFLEQDLPISEVESDQYNRKQFFIDLINQLKRISFNSEKGFSIGINSSWGLGKTSLLKIIKKEFDDENNIITLEYNPWLAVNKHSLTYDFFLMIENELSKHIETSNLLSTYGEKLSKIDIDKNPLKSFANSFKADKSLQEQFESIGKLIKSTNKRIFVIIDDLDRLDNFEVLEVLRLIRNTGNFPRINFIVAYDKSYVQNALEVNKIWYL